MCYLVAKKFKQAGSLAIEMPIGKQLSELSKKLTIETLDNDVQIITVSNLSAFMEYAPYTLIEKQKDFEEKVLAMN